MERLMFRVGAPTRPSCLGVGGPKEACVRQPSPGNLFAWQATPGNRFSGKRCLASDTGPREVFMPALRAFSVPVCLQAGREEVRAWASSQNSPAPSYAMRDGGEVRRCSAWQRSSRSPRMFRMRR